MDKSTRLELRNAVKYVLTNELGFSRDDVKEMVSKLTSSHVESHIATLIKNGGIDEVVRRVIDREISRGSWSGSGELKRVLSSAVEREAQKRAIEIVRNQLKISVVDEQKEVDSDS